MPAKRPETGTGSGNRAARAAVHSAAAACLLGGVLLLSGAPPASAAEAAATGAPKPPATAPAAKPAAARTTSASDSTFRAPGAAPAKVAPAPTAGAPAPSARNASTPSASAPGAASTPEASSAARTAQPQATTPVAPAPVTPARKSGTRPATVSTVRSGIGPAPPPGSPAAGVSRLAVSGSKPKGVQTVAHLDQKLTYQYNALGRRDPFQPMVGGEFVGADVGGDAPVDVGGMKVVGIVWGTEDKFAMVEDGRGQSMVLRVGDKVMNGVVESLKREAVVIRITTDGQTQSVSIPLTRKGEKSNATR